MIPEEGRLTSTDVHQQPRHLRVNLRDLAISSPPGLGHQPSSAAEASFNEGAGTILF